MNYDEWEKGVPNEFKSDVLWKMKVYRLAVFISDLGWYDVSKLVQDQRTQKLSDQLYRALGSISSNLAEGYSRSTGKARALYFEYALGSARESREWVYKGRHFLGEKVVNHRVKLITEIIRLSLTMLPEQRQCNIREEQALYETDFLLHESFQQDNDNHLISLLTNIPLPEL